MANKKNIFKAATGFIGLTIIIIIINMIDFAVIYSIFLYFQFLLAPFMTGIGYLFYIARLSIPYIFMYFLICVFFNIQTYRRNSTIKFLKYTIDVNAVKKLKLYIYIRQYNYVFIIAFNLALLFIVYYAYINNKYFYLLFIFLFYLFIWIIIKVKQWLFKNENLQYKKVHMLVNLVLVVLVGTYISMALDDLHISNVKLYGFENFWKLIDNKFFIKMPSKDFNWHRLFNWSKQVSTDRYMYAFKKGLIKVENFDKTINTTVKQKMSLDLNLKEKALLPLDSQNDDFNLNQNKSISDYLNKVHNSDDNLSKFSNTMYQKFKKVFLLQLQIKPSIFIPTPEINERHKLFSWLKNPNNIIDLSDLYLSTNTDDPLYNNYLDLVEKKFNNLTTKKVFLITLNKNYVNFKDFTFYADFENSFKKNYALFLNSERNNIDLKNNSTLNFEYYNSDLYLNYNFNDLLQKIKSEIYIIFKENKRALSLFIKKFKSLYSIKTFKFSFKKDVLTESDNELISELKPKVKKLIKIPDFKKLQVWKTFKLNYKEILYNHTKELRISKLSKPIVSSSSEKWLYNNKFTIAKEPLNEIFFVVEDDIAYCLTDYNKLTQVENLVFGDVFNEYDSLSEYISYYLENIKGRSKAIELISKKKFKRIFINEVEKSIIELQHKRVHVPMFNSMYHEILLQNSNEKFKYILENFEISRDLLTISRSFMTFDMWCTVMQKLLNLNLNSFYLKNLTDFTEFCKSDAIDDLQFNFSLAFDLLQNKYDLTKLQMIPDLEGLPSTFYEYTVKYNAHMDRYYWYEEQEALIDWIYEISYYSLVNIMDTVKEVKNKENDFLYDMVNMYLREPKYKWIAESFDSKIDVKPTAQLILLNKKLDYLNEIEYINQQHKTMALGSRTNFNYIKLVDTKFLMNFDDINNFKELDLKLGKDLNFLKNYFEWKYYQMVKSYPLLTEDFFTLHHSDMHNNEFELFLQMYTQEQNKFNLDVGVVGGVGVALNHFVYFEKWIFDDFFEIENLKKLDFFMEELDSKMHMGYDNLIETEEFDIWLTEEKFKLYDEFQYVINIYKMNLQGANYNIVNKMLANMSTTQDIEIENDFEKLKFNDLLVELEKVKCIELQYMELENLPIFNWYTYAYIDENMDLLMKTKPDILLRKLELLEIQIKNEELKLAEIKKVTKLYGKKFIKHAMEKPETKRYLEKNWDDYNYLSNKSDKVMRDWYKNGKKR